MNKKILLFFLIVCEVFFTLWGQDVINDSGANVQLLAQRYILPFYKNQNLIGASNILLENMMLKQQIQTIGPKGTETSIVMLYTKGPKTCLVYTVDKTGRPIIFLQRDNETWIYRENLRLPMKISLSQRVSGEANLGDILGLNLLDDFAIVQSSQNEAGISILFSRKSSGYPYPSIEVFVEPKSGDLYQILYNGAGGNAIRRAELNNYTTVSGNHRMPLWTIRNLTINKEFITTIRYLEIKSLAIPDSFFQPNANALSQFLIWARSNM